jgi:glucose/galactose transporter
MGISNKVAGIIAGLVFGYIALSDADGIEDRLKAMDEVTRVAELNALAARVIFPYIIITAVLIILAIGILFSPLPDIKEEGEEDASGAAVQPSGKKSILQFPHLFLGVLAIFTYVGVEVMAGDTIISYGKSLGIELSIARYFTQATLACMLIGYVVGIATIPKYISQDAALKFSAIIGVAFTLLAVFSSGVVSVAGIALLGLANALMWPAIFPLAIEGLGKFTKTGSALLIMGIAGGAILPLVYGKLSESMGTQQAYWLMVPCYIYIFYFATKGHKVGRA